MYKSVRRGSPEEMRRKYCILDIKKGDLGLYQAVMCVYMWILFGSELEL